MPDQNAPPGSADGSNPAARGAPGGFFVTGGALSIESASYLPRRADDELLSGLQAGELCYVLTSRQRGKSSLMIRAAHHLRTGGSRVAVLDLTRLGQNLTPEQWYLGLLDLLAESLNLAAELEQAWNQPKGGGPMYRWFHALTEAALPAAASPLIVFVDEIDTVGSLPFSTREWFAAIRECHNRRAFDGRLRRLTFCLLGVASAADLIGDPRATPFNLGKRIELADFTFDEARPLAAGLRPGTPRPERCLERVLFWTNGHPYLTQKLCAALAARPPGASADVDRMCRELFFGADARKREDNLLFVAQQLLRPDTDRAGLLETYRKVRRGKPVRDLDANPLVETLRLSGITTAVQGGLAVRNRIYRAVFDEAWINQNLPQSELRRQRAAFRKGLKGGVLLAVALAALLLSLRSWLRHRADHQACDQLGAAYQTVQTYRDESRIRLDCGTLSAAIESRFAFGRPNKFRLESSLSVIFGEIQLLICCDGVHLWLYAPATKQYVEEAAPPDVARFIEDGGRIEPAFEVLRQLMPVYFLLLGPDVQQGLHAGFRVSSAGGWSQLNGVPARPFNCLAPATLHVPQGDGRFLDHQFEVPTTLWERQADGLFVGSSADLQAELASLAANKVQILKFTGTNLTAVCWHRNISVNPALDPDRFVFHPSPGVTRVPRLDFTRVFTVFPGPSQPMFPP